jgi:uncharacterized membrane protein
MSNYGDLSPGGFDERGGWYDAARARVRGPGLFLQVFGVIIVGFFAMNGALSLINPNAIVDWQYDWVESIQKDQPPEQRQKLPPREEAVQSQRVQGPLISALWIAAGIVIFIGGSKMKELRGYGWAMTASILAMFPGMCCCCTGLVPGIWALVVLLNSDVKLAFSRNASGDRDVPMDSRME